MGETGIEVSLAIVSFMGGVSTCAAIVGAATGVGWKLNAFVALLNVGLALKIAGAFA